MAFTNTANSPLSSTEKASVDHDEDVEAGGQHHTHNKRDNMKLHGDRGLALVGDERIPLTEEDVRYSSLRDAESR
jgi:hypothetical protein